MPGSVNDTLTTCCLFAGPICTFDLVNFPGGEQNGIGPFADDTCELLVPFCLPPVSGFSSRIRECLDVNMPQNNYPGIVLGP